MSRIDELVAELCPNGVEWREIGTVLDYEQPTKYLVSSKDYSDDFATPVLTAGKTFILGYTSETDGIYPASAENPVIIFDDFTTDFKWVDFPFKAKSSGMKMLTAADENLATIRYAYYAMQMISFSPLDHKRHWISEYSHFEIPVPPIEVQREIVRILDSFAELEAELEAELGARKAQYAYYRDRLLSLESLEALDGKPVEMVRLGDVADVRGRIGFRGYKKTDQVKPGEGAISVTPGNIENGFLSFEDNTYVSWDKYEESPEIKLYEGDVLLVKTGSTVGKVSQVVELPEKATINPQMAVLKNITCSQRFLMYSLQSYELQRQIRIGAGVGSVPNISQEKIGKLMIPIPSLATQQQIVDILDRFDALTTSLTDGLPAEIEARKAQYAYYRDRLLDFPAKEVLLHENCCVEIR